MSGLKSFVLGATGAVGKELVSVLALNEAFSKVTIIARRKLELGDDEKFKKVDQCLVDFEKLDDFASAFEGFDVGFCCLGTTKGKSGAKGFYRVDHDYVVESAKLAKKGGCKDFHLVTAQGSNKNSWFLYPKTKGIVEQEVGEMEFSRVSIYRPGLLLCEREVLDTHLLILLKSVHKF